MKRVAKKTADDTHVTITVYDKLVEELQATLKEFAAKIPHFQHRHPKTAKLVKMYRSVPEEFIEQMTTTVEHSEKIASFGTFDPQLGLDVLQFLQAFRPLRGQVAQLLSAINYTMEVRKAEAAAQALQTYDLIKALNRDRKNRMNPHVEHLRRAMNRSGKRKGKTSKTAK